MTPIPLRPLVAALLVSAVAMPALAQNAHLVVPLNLSHSYAQGGAAGGAGGGNESGNEDVEEGIVMTLSGGLPDVTKNDVPIDESLYGTLVAWSATPLPSGLTFIHGVLGGKVDQPVTEPIAITANYNGNSTNLLIAGIP